MGHEISLQGVPRGDPRANPGDHHPDLQRDGRAYRERRVGVRSWPHGHQRAAAVGACKRDASHQWPLVAPFADGVPRIAQALLAPAVLGAWIFFDDVGQCHRRYHTSVSGIAFQAGCYRRQPVVVHLFREAICRQPVELRPQGTASAGFLVLVTLMSRCPQADKATVATLHIRNRPCPVTSRIRPRFCIQSRLR